LFVLAKEKIRVAKRATILASQTRQISYRWRFEAISTILPIKLEVLGLAPTPLILN